MQNVLTLAARVRRLIMDVDGVLTDGKLWFNPQGEEIKAFNTLDGHGLKMLQGQGVQLAIITGRASGATGHRARALGIDHLYMGSEGKLPAFLDILEKTGLSAEECAYVGDDVIDLPVMRRVGFPVAVPAAPNIVLSHAQYVTGRQGGEGAVREVCELILQAQGRLDAALRPYLED